jgi:predicted DNA-binding protein
MAMQKYPVAVRLDEDVYERLQTLAKLDRRTVSNILAFVIEKGLPLIEARIRAHAEPGEIQAPRAVAAVHN